MERGDERGWGCVQMEVWSGLCWGLSVAGEAEVTGGLAALRAKLLLLDFPDVSGSVRGARVEFLLAAQALVRQLLVEGLPHLLLVL